VAGYEQKILKLLKKIGVSVKRNPRGSHVIWGNGKINVSVPAKIKKRHAANAILKDAGINKKFQANLRYLATKSLIVYIE